MIDSIRRYMEECPLLEGIPPGIDRTEESPGSGIIVGDDVIKKRYLDGSECREYNFELRARLRCEERHFLENAEWAEQMKSWCAAQTEKKAFPELPHGCAAIKISASGGLLTDRERNGKTGLYSIKFKLTYIKTGGKEI